MKHLLNQAVDRLTSRIAEDVAKRIIDGLANRLITMSASAGLTTLMLNAALNTIPKDITPYILYGHYPGNCSRN